METDVLKHQESRDSSPLHGILLVLARRSKRRGKQSTYPEDDSMALPFSSFTFNNRESSHLASRRRLLHGSRFTSCKCFEIVSPADCYDLWRVNPGYRIDKTNYFSGVQFHDEFVGAETRVKINVKILCVNVFVFASQLLLFENYYMD